MLFYSAFSFHSVVLCIDGGFSNWARWGDCSQTCNGGIKKRTRTCSRPFPVTDGLVCDGPRTEYENCSKDIQCPCGMVTSHFFALDKLEL